MTAEWHSYKKKRVYFHHTRGIVWDITKAWRGALSQHMYFCQTRYKNGSVMIVKTRKDIENLIRRKKIQRGDLLHFVKKNKIHHAAIITEVSYRHKAIYYASHTKSRRRQNLAEKLAAEDKIYITMIRDCAC